MDLFTYLGAKKEKFTLPHKGDLFAYLLGKNSKLPIQEASGTTIEISAKKKNIVELTLDHMCEQTGTPTPSDPIPVVVADGFRNLFDGLLRQGNQNDNTVTSRVFMDQNDFHINEGDVITFSTDLDTTIYSYSFYIYENEYLTPSNTQLYTSGYQTTPSFTLTAGYTGYLGFAIKKIEGGDITPSDFSSNHFQIETGDVAHPYVDYGSNYLNLVITNGVDTTNNLINLGNNFIGGIGDYKDVLTIDDTGHVSLVKNIGKVVWDETITVSYDSDRNTLFVSVTNKNASTTTDKKVMSDYFNGSYTTISANQWTNYPNNSIGSRGGGSFIGVKASQFTSGDDFKTWLSTHNTIVYYVLETPTTVDLGTVDIELFKGANTITNSDNCNMVLKYY